MALSYDLISQFAKVVNNTKKQSDESTIYGTVVTDNNGNKYVKLDGSDQLTPLTDENRPDVDTSTATAETGDRVSVLIKDHTATVTGNVSSPSVRSDDFDDAITTLTEFDTAIGDRVQANEGYIKQLETDKANIGDLTAATARITDLEADNVTINESLTAANAEITSLKTTKLDADMADIKFATIDSLDVTNAKINGLEADYADFETATANKFTAVDASISNLDTAVFDAETGNIKFANIDFSNITEATIENFFTKTGMIENVIIGESTITGALVGVTIKGDLIEAGTVKADKLVVLGEDGLYYKLNVNTLGEATASSDEKYQNGLHGDAILANTITAEKINVNDLIAFGATIGHFHIDENDDASAGSIYSGTKSSIDNTTRGIYLDTDGQAYIGDSNNYLKFYKDTDGSYKLAISAESMIFSSSKKTVTEVIDEVKTDIDTLRDEITTLLRIESSRGTVFKNDQVATVLSVVIYHGKQRITDSDTMKSVFGSSAYLQWKWQRLDDESFGIISSGDSRFGDNGFTFTLSPEDVDTKVTFMCELIIE